MESEVICKTCGHCGENSRNPARMGICHDPDNIRASPTGKPDKVVRLWQTCSNWTPRNCDNCAHSYRMCEICKDIHFWECKEAL